MGEVLIVDGVEFREATANPLALLMPKLSPGVHCLTGWFQNWGRDYLRLAAHTYKAQLIQHKNGPAYHPEPPKPFYYDKAWALSRIDKALSEISKGLVLAVFPTFAPYNKNASLLLERGFRLLGSRCYPNANYPISGYSTLPKNSIYSQDGYPHWIHVWSKDLGGLENCGESTPALAYPSMTYKEPPELVPFHNCCGLKMRWTTGALKPDPYNPAFDFQKYLAICQLPATQKFDKGFKRFALYKDFKWGINLDSPFVKGVQKCPHEFDLDKIEKWELEQPLPKL